MLTEQPLRDGASLTLLSWATAEGLTPGRHRPITVARPRRILTGFLAPLLVGA